MEGQPLGGAGPDARQPLELIDQAGQGPGEAAQGSAANGLNLGGGQGRPGAARRPPLRMGAFFAGPPTMALARPPLMRLRDQLLRTLPLLLSLLLLVGCSATAAGLQSFQSPDGRYAFLYPTGWTRVQVQDGPQLVFHDLINSDETLSLVISEVDAANNLVDLGSAVAVGERLRRTVIAPEGSGREAELVEAKERELNSRTFYDLEYAVHLADRDRHELATVVVDRGRLYTFAASTNEARWSKVRELFERVISSFTLLI